MAQEAKEEMMPIGVRFNKQLVESQRDLLKHHVGSDKFNKMAKAVGYIASEFVDLKEYVEEIVESENEMKEPAVQQGLTKDDIEFIKYMRTSPVFQTTIWDVFASETSETSKSIDTAESTNENDTESKEDDAKKERFCPENENNYRYAWCAISGEKIDLKDPNYKKLDDNDPERLTCVHLIPSDYWGMSAIRKILNEGCSEKFDVHCSRNMVFCKGKYGAAMNERKISVEWTDKDGYSVFVDEPFRDEYKDSNGNRVHGKKLSIYTHGKLNKSKSGPNWPYRRAFAWHLAITQRRVAQLFQEMRNASMTEDDS